MGRAGSAGQLGWEICAKLNDTSFISGLLFRTHWKGTQGLPVDTCFGPPPCSDLLLHCEHGLGPLWLPSVLNSRRSGPITYIGSTHIKRMVGLGEAEEAW